MAISINKILLGGNLVADAEVKGTVTVFRIAVNSFRDGEDALFMRVATFGNTAKNCEILRKGDSVIVDGRLKEDKWEKDDGTIVSRVEVNAFSVNFVSVSAWSDAKDGQDKKDLTADDEKKPVKEKKSVKSKTKKDSESAAMLSSMGDDISEDEIPF